MAASARDLVDEGRAALDRGDWAAARSLLTDALARDESAEVLYLLARAVEWAGQYERAIELYERAYLALRERGECRLPALIAARELSFLYAAVYGNAAAAGGWLARAQSLSAEAGDCVERGWVELAAALMTDDPAAKETHVRVAAEIAHRFDDPDLRFCALGYEGTNLVLRGDITEGMRRVDEAATAATNGEVRDYLTAGEIYCKMLLCCELSVDVRRAQQWMRIVADFGAKSNALWVSAICRTHYGGILTAAGNWADAERELSRSIRLYDETYPALRSSALVRLADLRVRQGRYGEAARLLAGFESDSYAVRPLARLHLARGDADVAISIVRRALARTGDHPLRAPELALLAEAEVAAGRLDDARGTVSRLAALAENTALPRIQALAEFAAGITCAAADDPAALAHLEAALPGFRTSGLPLEEARTRLAIAKLVAESAPSVAVVEAKAAIAVFDALAAAPDADATASVLRRLGATGRPGPRADGVLTKRESEVLRLVAEGLANEQIAGRLFISKRTVEHHVGNIFAKLGVATRVEAAAHALRGETRSVRRTGEREAGAEPDHHGAARAANGGEAPW